MSHGAKDMGSCIELVDSYSASERRPLVTGQLAVL